ncbi:MAG: hypothetical protein ACTSYX_01050 [Candidatus Thorarchaeota archaeon]
MNALIYALLLILIAPGAATALMQSATQHIFLMSRGIAMALILGFCVMLVVRSS